MLIWMEKNVPWHILAPSAVACDMFLLRASAHPAERFFCHRTKFPMTQKMLMHASLQHTFSFKPAHG
ncbi:hypothetical protein DXB05_09460 [Clostridium sp. OF13-4]|nr:hypothetical protein DXB05_09460 [Clostridium sp. OF13-4]